MAGGGWNGDCGGSLQQIFFLVGSSSSVSSGLFFFLGGADFRRKPCRGCGGGYCPQHPAALYPWKANIFFLNRSLRQLMVVILS